MKEKVVLAYSGGLDTSIIISWLKENYEFDVIAACINVGQQDDMAAIEKKALASGASKVYIEDMCEEFVTDCIYKAVKAEAKYEGKYFLGTSLARPIMAKRLAEIAQKEGAKYICHGCTGKGNDQVRFEISIGAIDPSLQIIAPWRIWDIKSREDAIDYANERGIEISVTKKKIYSRDENLWHISHEGGDLEDMKNEYKNDMLMKSVAPEDAPNEPTYVEIGFVKGEPKTLNGVEVPPVELIKTLNKLGGENGIGTVDLYENRLVGMKSRGVYETPAGTILYAAHSMLESVTLEKNALQYKQLVSIKIGELIYEGLWYTTLMDSLNAFIDTTQETVTGSVKVKLYKGNIKPAGIFTENSLIDEGISSFGASEFYDHKDSAGFIKIFGLPQKIAALKKMGK